MTPGYKKVEQSLNSVVNLVNMINEEQEESDTLLDVELKQVGSVVFGRVLKQSESLRGTQNPIMKCCGFAIGSYGYPVLVSQYLWVRGIYKELDNDLFYYDYGTEDAAKMAYGNFQGMIKAINGRRAEKQEIVSDRFIVDKQSRIITVCDTHHPEYKSTPEYYGGSPWVVASWGGTTDTVAMHWGLDPWQIEKAQALADLLNGRER